MIDPRQLAFDIDGVLADTMQLFLEILRRVYGINHISYHDITQYQLDACLDVDPKIISAANQRIIDGDYPGQLKPFEGVERVLKRLHSFGPIILVTARPHLGPMLSWVDQILPSAQYAVEIIATGSYEAKTEVLKQKNKACFVEDRLETCFLLQQHDITPVVFAQPWNRRPHPFLEVDNWDQLEEAIQWG